MENSLNLWFLHYFFLIFHTAFTLFNCLGWIWVKTRKIHLVTMSATFLSWFVLGIFYGWGYCFCTHWHWIVMLKLGRIPQSSNYIHFLILEWTSWNPDQVMVGYVTMSVFLVLIPLTAWVNIRAYLNRKGDS